MYKGQNANILVNRKILPAAKITVPAVPVTTPVKFKKHSTMAINTLTTLSVSPKFFFMMVNVEVSIS